MIRFGSTRFTSTTCSVTVDSFSVINNERFIRGSFDVSGATNGSETHATAGRFTVSLGVVN